MEIIKLYSQVINIPSPIKKWLFENKDSATKTKILSDALLLTCSLSFAEIKEESNKVKQFFKSANYYVCIGLRDSINIKISDDLKNTLRSCSTTLGISQNDILLAAIAQISTQKGSEWESVFKIEIQRREKEREKRDLEAQEERRQREEARLKQQQEAYDDDDDEENNRDRRYKYPYIGKYYAPVKWIGSRIRWAKEHGRPVCFNRYLEDAAYRYDLDANELFEKFQEYANAGKRNTKYRRSCYR